MAYYRATNVAFQARWHRQIAADLFAVGRVSAGEERLRLAQELDRQLVDNRQCKLCSRPLRGDESVDRGYGPECRKKLTVAV